MLNTRGRARRRDVADVAAVLAGARRRNACEGAADVVGGVAA